MQHQKETNQTIQPTQRKKSTVGFHSSKTWLSSFELDDRKSHL